MKSSLRCLLNKRIVSLFAVFSVLASLIFTTQFNVCAVTLPVFNSKTDINYSGEEGSNVFLTHKKADSAQTVSYYVDDYSITRNATIYLSVNAKFTNSESWGIRLRNVSCKVGGETVSGDLVFRLFKNSGVAQVGNTSITQEKWASFNNINDNNWHKIVIKSDTKGLSLWIDGDQAKGMYYDSKVTDISFNYSCPGIFMGGYNEGILKNVTVWNNGTSENPVMPADKVVKNIASLKATYNLTVSDENLVKQIKNQYNSLSSKEKEYVYNYSELEEAELTINSIKYAYDINVSGTVNGKFKDVFGNGVITHTRKDSPAKYYFESGLSRNSTYYSQFMIDFDFAYSFDFYLRQAEYTVKGQKVSSVIGIRFFAKTAAVVDEKQNRLSSFINYSDISKGLHVITVKSSPKECVVWIDGIKHEFEHFLVSGKDDSAFASAENVDNLSAKTGFYLGSNENYGAFGKIFNIRIYNDKNTSKNGENQYSIGDEARISIFKLKDLNAISLNDKKNIYNARYLVDELNKDDLKYVTNIEKLEKLERAIAFLEEKGEHAYNFLKDNLPVIKSNDENLISSTMFVVSSDYMNDVSYNNVTHSMVCKNDSEYINVDFKSPANLSAEDTYVIKFKYTPHSYLYETETSAWMGLRVFFSGYEVGGNGQKSANKTQLAFMTNDIGIISTVNSVTGTCDYYGGYKIELNKSYDVVMLCEQGRMKLWINGSPVAYYDDLPKFAPSIAFQFSRCNCDVDNIQLYNYTDSAPYISVDNTENTMKFVDDLLYGKEGASLNNITNAKKIILIITSALSVLIISIFVMCLIRYKKKSR